MDEEATGEIEMVTRAERRTNLIQLFRDRAYRRRYIENFYNTRLAAQIKVLREARDSSQQALAKKIETQQSAISKLESANYASWNVKTLRRLARAFDVVLQVRFVTYGEALEDIEQFSKPALAKAPFKDDPVFQAPPAQVTVATTASIAPVASAVTYDLPRVLWEGVSRQQDLYGAMQLGRAVGSDEHPANANDNLALAS